MPVSTARLADIDFLIIGATKSATTWLQTSLQVDHQVCMPGPEIHFFSREYHRGHNWYLAQFPQFTDGQLVGEKSNSYLECPEAARRINKVMPNVLLIAQLRNPIERAYSDYCMLFRRGEVGPDIERYLDPRYAVDGRFLAGGLYYRQLSAYLERYEGDQLLVQLYEDLHRDPKSHLARVRKFLGLAEVATSPAIKDRVKDKNTPVIAPGLRRYLRPFKSVVAPLRKYQYFKTLHGIVARKLKYTKLSSDLCERLIEYYSEDVEHLGKLMQRDLSGWLRETPSIVSESPAIELSQ